MEKLLEGVEVEWKALGEVAELYGGLSGKNKEDFDNGNALYISYKNIFDNIEINFDKLESVKVSDSENQHEVKYGDILFTGSSETAEEAGMSSSVTTKFEDKVYLNSFSFGVRFNDNILIIPQFSKYLFRSHFMRTEIAKTASGVTRFNISKARFKKLLIPIPPIKVQEEIVRILDAFTELTAELTVELTARKKQYDYYRDKLLTFDDGEVEWKTLGEIIIKAYSGATPLANNTEYYNNGSIPWLRTQEVRFVDIYETDMKITESALIKTAVKWVPENCVIIAISGATAGRSAINKIPLTTNQHCLCLEINAEKANYRYVFHWVSSQYEYIKNLGQGARGDLNAGIIKSLKIPLPPLPEQERIASMLDKFDALTSSITEGLPREIELRQKQYEYYRNMLLSFPKSEVEA
ncbi:restriction endonuclease subunit S [Paenibacillus durus]|uniref:Restriction endonuclease subunit S n=2 Tax=Paenibacillus durus TaxID=44251 RepID=A0A089HLR3_PAEDU|nr:restriction endonuclease subunit S [Paenibacillus durus]